VSDERGGAGLDGPAKLSFTAALSPLPGDEASVFVVAEAGAEAPGGAGYAADPGTPASGCCPGSPSLHIQLHLYRKSAHALQSIQLLHNAQALI